jgi:DNA-binding NtrC family response regulator
LRAAARAHLGDRAGAAGDLTATALGDEPPPLDIMAEAQRVTGAVLRIEGDGSGARAACERSARIFTALGHLRAADEVRTAAAGALAGGALEGGPASAPATASSASATAPVWPSTDLLLRRAAAALGQAARPDLLGPELLALAIESGTATAAAVVTEDDNRGAAVIQAAGWSEQEALAAAVTSDPPAIALGIWRGMDWRLVARVPSTVVARTAWTSIHSLAASGVALATARQEAREREALWPIDDPDDPAPGIFASEQMLELLRIARRVAQTGVTVLLTGETGVGKEVFARVIHDASRRAGKPFRTVNCSAVPRDMLENHLFGHRRGAYTGADEAASGALRAAAGGTVFLDEIGDVGYHIQPKLLRFLESGEIQPLGEPHTMQVDVRIVAATNKDLDRLVSDGQFRDDLYYRLNIVRLHIPPLRERREEIPSLVQHFLERFSREFHKTRLRLADETMEYLLLHPWPGNVRQLQNELRRMAALAEPGAVLMPEHLSRWVVAGRLTKPVSERERELQPTEVVVRLDQPLAAATEHVERAMIQHAMAICDGRVEQVARMLGLSRKGLYLKRQRLGIEQPH